MTDEGETSQSWPTQIAIIGAGTMGLGIAEQFALAGHRVLITDATPELARQAKQKLVARVSGHVAAGLLPESALARLDLVESRDDIPATVAGADFILEAVPEDRAAISEGARPLRPTRLAAGDHRVQHLVLPDRWAG